MPERIILDTDIGTDVDDALAVALAALSPELTVEGITTVYGDVALRARMAVKILRLLGREDIPVLAGAEHVLLRNRPLWWLGHEGDGLLTAEDANLPFDPRHAVDFIIQTVMDNPGEITLVAIGPFTNLAIALAREPRLAENVKNVIIMGGSARLGANGMELEYIDHNVKCDPESAALLFTAGLAHTLHGFFSGLGSSGATLTVALYVYAKERGEFEVAFAIAAILMLLTLIINLSADLVARYFRRKKEL